MMNQFPRPYRDELFSSILARCALRLGNSRDIHDFEDIYGIGGNQIFTVEIPARVDRIIENLPPCNTITSKEIIDNHSMVPFFMAFKSNEAMNRLYKSMKECSGSVSYNKVGLSGYRFKINRHLRYCPICQEENIERYGEGYWDRIHNIPGILVCAKHSTPLELGPNYRQGNRQRFIPFTRNILDSSSKIKYTKSIMRHASTIMNLVKDILHNRYQHYDREWFTNQIRLRLIESGYANMTGYIDQKRLIHDITTYYGVDFLGLIDCEIGKSDANWVSNISRSNGKSSHPMKLILVYNFLGCDADQIFRKYITRDGCETLSDYQEIWDERLVDLIDMDLSLRKICETLSSSKKTVLRRVDQLGLNYDPKKRYNGGGRHLGKAYIETDDFILKRKKNRKIWTDLVYEYPDDYSTDLLKKEPVVHRWLQKYDLHWLNQNKPRKQKFKRTIDWKKRDSETFPLVKKLIEEMENGMPQRVTLGTVASRLGITWLLKGVDLMPMTKTLISEHETTLTDFHKKRLIWAVNQIENDGDALTYNRICEVSGVNRRYITDEVIRKIESELLMNGIN